MLQGASSYKKARGIHTAALADGDQILLQVEDVGRHNCLDKLSGAALQAGIKHKRSHSDQQWPYQQRDDQQSTPVTNTHCLLAYLPDKPIRRPGGGLEYDDRGLSAPEPDAHLFPSGAAV